MSLAVCRPASPYPRTASSNVRRHARALGGGRRGRPVESGEPARADEAETRPPQEAAARALQYRRYAAGVGALAGSGVAEQSRLRVGKREPPPQAQEHLTGRRSDADSRRRPAGTKRRRDLAGVRRRVRLRMHPHALVPGHGQ